MSELDAIMKGKTNLSPTDDAAPAAQSEDSHGVSGQSEKASGYDYLLGMNLWSLTFEKVEEIKKLLASKEQELDDLRRTSLEYLWDRDLQALAEGLDELEVLEAEEAEAETNAASERRRKKGGAARVQTPAATSTTSATTATAARGRKEEYKMLASKPPTPGAAAAALAAQDHISKTTWGVDSTSGLSSACSAPAASSGNVDSGLCAPPAAATERPAKVARPALKKADVPAKVVAQAQKATHEGSSAILRRLLENGKESAGERPACAAAAPPTFHSVDDDDDVQCLLQPPRSESTRPYKATFGSSAGSTPRQPLSELLQTLNARDPPKVVVLDGVEEKRGRSKDIKRRRSPSPAPRVVVLDGFGTATSGSSAKAPQKPDVGAQKRGGCRREPSPARAPAHASTLEAFLSRAPSEQPLSTEIPAERSTDPASGGMLQRLMQRTTPAQAPAVESKPSVARAGRRRKMVVDDDESSDDVALVRLDGPEKKRRV